MYTETKKFSNTSHLRIIISEIHVDINTNLIRFFCSKCDYNLIQYQILQNFICMERSACHKMLCKKTKMSIFWTFSTCTGDGSGQFRWKLTYQRQFQDVIQSGVAVWNVIRLDVIWMKSSSSGVRFFSVCPVSGGLQPTLFARNDWLYGKQLCYEFQNEKQHNWCWNQLPPC